MLDTDNHLYQWLKSPRCTVLGTKNDRCLQDKIILDSMVDLVTFLIFFVSWLGPPNLDYC